jgi:hypothetical protein
MKSLHLYRGGPGPLPPIIGGLIGIMVRAGVLVAVLVAVVTMVHTPKAQCIIKGPSLIKNHDHGAEQAVMRMRVRRQEGMEDIMLRQEVMEAEGTVAADRVADTANQCGG